MTGLPKPPYTLEEVKLGGSAPSDSGDPTDKTVVVLPGQARDEIPERAPLRQIGDYRIQAMIGRGGMGVVTLAFSPDGEAVALKLLPPESLDEVGRRRFVREQDALARVKHEHVVQLRGAGFDEASGQPYIAMEWVPGICLHDVLERLGRLSPAESIYVLHALAQGLAAAHAEGVIHRDLKPSNVLVTPEGGVKLIDFGLALSEDVSQRLTRRGYVVGTRSFIPPEVLERDEPWSGASDCFALGVLGSYFLGGHDDLIVAELSQAPYDDPYLVVPAVKGLPGPPELRALLTELRQSDAGLRPSAAESAARLGELLPAPEALTQFWGLVTEFYQAAADDLVSRTLSVGSEAPARGTVGLEVGTDLNGYRIQEELSRGAMGAVFRAHHAALDRPVALKVLLAGDLASDEDRGRFLREAEASAALDHPNVVKVLDAGEARGAQYIVMELVGGGTLRGRMTKGEPLDPEDALTIFEGICAGVSHAHGRGVIHRDLKPENVMLGDGGRPQVTDFGLAKRVEEGAEDVHLTVDGALMGTVAYMAPEQARGQMRTLDVRADVYALGVMFYEFLCGQLPFTGHFAQLIDRKLRTDPTPPRKVAPGVPWELEAICLRAMEREPDRRYPTVQSLSEDLTRFRRGLPVQARPAGIVYRLRKWIGRHTWGVSLAAILVVVSSGAVGNTLWAVEERERIKAERVEADARETARKAQVAVREVRARAEEKRKGVEAERKGLEAERAKAEALATAEAKRVAAHEDRVRAEVGSAWEAAAVGSYTLAAELFQVASELVGTEPVAMNLDRLPVPKRLRQDLGVKGPEFVTPSLLREWSRGTRGAAVAAEASRLLGVGRTLRAEARAQYHAGTESTEVRKLYFRALEELRSSLRQVPDFPDALREHKGLSREFGAVLFDQGYYELADFVLMMAGGIKLQPTDLPKDPTLDVVEADKALIRHAFGGRVSFVPTKAFKAVREELRQRAPKLQCTLQIRTSIKTKGPIPTLWLTGVEVRIGNPSAGTIRPSVLVSCVEKEAFRPVSQDPRGFRVVGALERTRKFNLPRLVAGVRAAVLKEAGLAR